MSDRRELNAERLQAAIKVSEAEDRNGLASPEADSPLPLVQPNVEEAMAGGVLAAAIFKIVPSYLVSFLGHAVLIISLSVAASFALRGDRLALEGGVTIAAPAVDLEPAEVALELTTPVSELDELRQPAAEAASSLADALSVTGPSAGDQMLEGWGDGDKSEFDAAVAAAWEEELGGSEPVDKSKGDARFFGVHASGRRFVFIIDCSGSMQGLRWNLAKAELKNSIRNLEDDKEFLVILYNHEAWAMFDRTLKEADLVSATADSKRRFFQWLSRQEPRGWTRPRVALELALSRQPDAVFLLSDGELQDDSQQFLLAANQPAEREDGSRRQTPVHTVALDLSFGAGLLEQIAGQNSGVFTHITTATPPRR